MLELLPFFRARYSKYAGGGTPRIGMPVKIHVLPPAAFKLQNEAHKKELLEEERALLTTYRPILVSNTISGVGRGPTPSGPLITVTPNTRLTQIQLELLRPAKSEVSGETEPGGFYSLGSKTLFVRVDQVDIGVVAHEMTHAYTSPQWNEFQIAVTLQSGTVLTARGRESLGTVFGFVDEGVTSMLAQAVIDDWFSSPWKKGMIPRPSTAPRGLVGYLPDVAAQAETFVDVIDNKPGLTAAPGKNTFLAYFNGWLAPTYDEAKPLESEVRFGRDKLRKLKEIF